MHMYANVYWWFVELLWRLLGRFCQLPAVSRVTRWLPSCCRPLMLMCPVRVLDCFFFWTRGNVPGHRLVIQDFAATAEVPWAAGLPNYLYCSVAGLSIKSLRFARWAPLAPPVKVKISCYCANSCCFHRRSTACTAWVFPLGRFHSFVCSHMPMFGSWFLQSCFFGSSCCEHASCWGPNTTVANWTSSMFLLFPYAVFCSLRFFSSPLVAKFGVGWPNHANHITQIANWIIKKYICWCSIARCKQWQHDTHHIV